MVFIAAVNRYYTNKLLLGLQGGVVVSTVASQQRVPGSIPAWGLSVWSLHVLPVYVWLLFGYSGFLPPSRNMHVRLIGVSKLSLGVSVSVCGCLSRLSLCGPVMDWRPVQVAPRLSPDDRWDALQPPRDPTDGLSGYRKCMDGISTLYQQVLRNNSTPQQWRNALF